MNFRLRHISRAMTNPTASYGRDPVQSRAAQPRDNPPTINRSRDSTRSEVRKYERRCAGARSAEATRLKNAAGASGGIYHREAESHDTQKRETTVSGVFGVEGRKAAQPCDNHPAVNRSRDSTRSEVRKYERRRAGARSAEATLIQE